MSLISYLSVLEFKGNDASQFLQNQLSGDIAAIADGESAFACMCNPQGRVLALLLVRPGPDGCHAICAAALADMVAEQLRRFVFRMDVSITRRADLAVVPEKAGVGLEVEFRDPAGPGYGAIPADAVDTLPEAPPTAAHWKAAELAAGIAWLESQTSGRYLPQMLGFEDIGALSFRKGCYPGQEIIARTRYLGKLKRHPVRCMVKQTIEPGVRQEVTLAGAETEARAEIVDFSHREDGSTQLLLVARAPEGFKPEAVRWGGRDLPLRLDAHPSGRPDQGCATT